MGVIVAIKNAHALLSKKELESLMDGMPSGLWAELHSTIEGVELVALGYRYNRKKTLFFCATGGAGPTYAGAPYISSYADRYGNQCFREVPRPVLVSRYFHHSPVIDNHNQLRQESLALERTWGTSGYYFRIASTVFGMAFTDAFYAVKATRGVLTKDDTFQSFTETLALQMVLNEEERGDERPSRINQFCEYSTNHNQ